MVKTLRTLVGVVMLVGIVFGGLYTMTNVYAATAPIVKAPGDPPKIRWLDQTIVEGSNRFQIALKDESTITMKSITYTKYDPLFEEYDSITVGLIATTTPLIYYADIVVNFPQTIIEVRAGDAYGQESSDTKKFVVAPTTLKVGVSVKDTSVEKGEDLLLKIKNEHNVEMAFKATVNFENVALESSWVDSFKDEVEEDDDITLRVPVSMVESDQNRPIVVSVTIEAFGITQTFSAGNVVIEGDRKPQTTTELKGRYERVSFENAITVDSNVARIVLVVQGGSPLITPSGNNLIVDTSFMEHGRWQEFIYITNDDIPIEMRVYKMPSTDRTFFIIDVPEVGDYTVTGNALALVRHYL
jgi:hypothetical protein